MIRARGYILVETVTAMAVLSIVAVTVQQAVHTAVQARGLSQDYTTAQFLMEGIVAGRDLEPRIPVGEERAGTFPPPNERFEFSWALERVEIPLPSLPAPLTPEQRASLGSAYLGHMGKLRVEIRWYRGGQPFSVTGETLISPDRTWVDPSGAAL